MGEAAPGDRRAVRERAEVFSAKRVGDYTHLTMVSDGISRRARPGSFVAVAVGGPTTALLAPRVLWVHRARPSGIYGGTIEVVVAPRGSGTRWLAERRPHDWLDAIGPLGRPFSLPKEPVACALVGVGYAVAPLFALADGLRERRCAVHMVLGAHSEASLFGTLEARRAAQSVTVATLDGSVGLKGSVLDPLPALLQRSAIEVVYACGPADTLAAVTAAASAQGAWCQAAVEQPMSCATGLCRGCVVPVRGHDSVVRMTRACVEGPVFAGDRVVWGSIGTVPADAHGAPPRGRRW